MTRKQDVPPFTGCVDTTKALRLIHAVRQSFSIKFGSLKSLTSKRLRKPALCKPIGSYASASHSDHPRTRESTYQSLPGSDGESRTHTVLQGTISALKLIQQIVGLAPVPGLYSLIGVVLNISEVINVSFGATHISCKILIL